MSPSSKILSESDTTLSVEEILDAPFFQDKLFTAVAQSRRVPITDELKEEIRYRVFNGLNFTELKDLTDGYMKVPLTQADGSTKDVII
jgi:hypothetical protein